MGTEQPEAEGTAEGTIEKHHKHRKNTVPASVRGGLPLWLTVIVVLVLLGLLVWNILVVGPKGLGTTYVLGGLLGAYAGIDRLLKRDD